MEETILAPEIPVEAPFSQHVTDRAASMIRAGWLSRMGWIVTPAGSGYVAVTVPSFEHEKHPDEPEEYEVRYRMTAETTSCTCMAGRNGRHCSHQFLGLLWLDVVPPIRPEPELVAPEPFIADPVAGFRATWETWGGGPA